MASSLTKKGLLTASDKYILGARPSLEIIKNFTTDFSADAVKPGTGVVVDVVKAAAETFNASSANYTHTTNSSTPITVATNLRKKSTFELDDIDFIEDETAAALTGNAVAAGRAVGAELVKAVTGLLTRTARAAAETMSGFTLNDFFKLRAACEKTSGSWAGADPSTCVMLLEPVTYSALCSVLNAGIVGDGSVVRGAIIGQALGFKAVYSAPTISTDSAADNDGKGKGFIVPENAIAVVNRIVKPAKGVAGNLVEFGTTTDEVTGFTHTQRVVIDAAQGKVFWTTEALFGARLTYSSSNGAPRYLQMVVS